MVEEKKIQELEVIAAKCRKNILRMLKASGHGHIGGAFSSMEIVSALYFYQMKVDPNHPKDPNRDRFLLSAGHKCMVQYAVLAEKGFFKKEVLDTYGQFQTLIPGHPDMHKLPGIEANTGALGHGLAIAVGMAKGLKLDQKDNKVYVVIGDGELAEGSNWEAVAAAAHHGLDNVVAFVDYNGLQISGKVAEVMNFTPIDERFRAFGWSVKNVDGNNMQEVVEVMQKLPLEKGKPSLVVAHTVKACGLSEGEGKASYHYWSPSKESLQQAEQELDEFISAREEVSV